MPLKLEMLRFGTDWKDFSRFLLRNYLFLENYDVYSLVLFIGEVNSFCYIFLNRLPLEYSGPFVLKSVYMRGSILFIYLYYYFLEIYN